MFKAKTQRPSPWFVSHGFNMMVDFCVWALEWDGLRAPPFDHHADGTGALRAAGLDADGWRAWLDGVVALQAAQAASPDVPRPEPDGSTPAVLYPPAVWSGAPAVAALFDELWGLYGPLSTERSRWERQATSSPQWMRDTSRLWYDLKPYHARLATLNAYLVDYPYPVEYLVPPVSVVLGVKDMMPDAVTFRTTLRRVAGALAAEGGS